jgi:transcriptional regulator with XRE-family HTH domain
MRPDPKSNTELREALGISVNAMARLHLTTSGAVHQFERGQAVQGRGGRPHPDVAERLARTYGLLRMTWDGAIT